MKRKNIHWFLPMCFMVLAFAACAVFRADFLPPGLHPEPLAAKRPQCTDCHDKTDEYFPYMKFNHDLFFVENHRVQALSGKSSCTMCHKDSFCSECHGGRLELKPSIRKPGDTHRRIPHRGDYLTRHQIEGRINPVSCYRCHGNPGNAERCAKCHGR